MHRDLLPDRVSVRSSAPSGGLWGRDTTSRSRPALPERGNGLRRQRGSARAAAVRIDTLANRLTRAVSAHGCSDQVLVPLTAVCTALAMLGAPQTLRRGMIDLLANGEPLAATSTTRQLWQEMVHCRPFLTGHIDALVGWLDHAARPGSESDLARARALLDCFKVLAEVDLEATANQPGIDSEMLGPLYSTLRSPTTARAIGAFYTPMALSMTIARMTPVEEGRSILEPACGAGGMVIARARVMRASGRDPTTCTWVLNDLDPLAVALAGINCVIHGLGRQIMLCQGNGLLIGTGEPGDPLLDPGQQEAAVGAHGARRQPAAKNGNAGARRVDPPITQYPTINRIAGNSSARE